MTAANNLLYQFYVNSYFLNEDSSFTFHAFNFHYPCFRYNPENMSTLEHYVELQALENTYDLEANLALLKLYQFNPGTYKTNIACLILLKALTNLPHTDFVLCKCLLLHEQVFMALLHAKTFYNWAKKKSGKVFFFNVFGLWLRHKNVRKGVLFQCFRAMVEIFSIDAIVIR